MNNLIRSIQRRHNSDKPITMANTRLSATIPASTATCSISIIDATCDLQPHAQVMLEPVISGMEHLDFPTYSFHVTHNPSGRQFLFDMGARKDWKNSVPQLVQVLEEAIGGLDVKKEVPTILAEGGVRIENIEAMILSHWHFDHTGNIAKLPTPTKLVVGPGFKDEFMPGYPANPKSFFWEEEFEGREVVEIAFSSSLTIGQFHAHDYLGDGSLYILDVPGHATGHISALVRTTLDTFVFLGGDVCHHAGVLRPTSALPLPNEIPKETAMLGQVVNLPCPCGVFLACHPSGEKSDGKVRTSSLHYSLAVELAHRPDCGAIDRPSLTLMTDTLLPHPSRFSSLQQSSSSTNLGRVTASIRRRSQHSCRDRTRPDQ
jgi:glyoxylase-like metal-dependent hydrolase (beta-lactamase superfamily II)